MRRLGYLEVTLSQGRLLLTDQGIADLGTIESLTGIQARREHGIRFSLALQSESFDLSTYLSLLNSIVAIFPYSFDDNPLIDQAPGPEPLFGGLDIVTHQLSWLPIGEAESADDAFKQLTCSGSMRCPRETVLLEILSPNPARLATMVALLRSIHVNLVRSRNY